MYSIIDVLPEVIAGAQFKSDRWSMESRLSLRSPLSHKSGSDLPDYSVSIRTYNQPYVTSDVQALHAKVWTFVQFQQRTILDKELALSKSGRTCNCPVCGAAAKWPQRYHPHAIQNTCRGCEDKLARTSTGVLLLKDGDKIVAWNKHGVVDVTPIKCRSGIDEFVTIYAPVETS